MAIALCDLFQDQARGLAIYVTDYRSELDDHRFEKTSYSVEHSIALAFLVCPASRLIPQLSDRRRGMKLAFSNHIPAIPERAHNPSGPSCVQQCVHMVRIYENQLELRFTPFQNIPNRNPKYSSRRQRHLPHLMLFEPVAQTVQIFQ
jgi:hypothetical protein